MLRSKLSVFVVAITPFLTVPAARAQVPDDAFGQSAGPQVTEVDPNQPAAPPEENPIPPNVEGQAVPSQGGGYCYGGPHPAPGGGWEATTSPHMHEYAPFDLRLFSFHDGCYYFVGDPKDFGYTGESYSYYGAHPILDSYGGGWCFMIGAHTHWWRPWSSYFTVVGPWYYWNGPYDPFFWSYWPYYSFYYRSYYPSYYAGGRFYRTWRAAPPITHVPATGWRGNATGGWRGSPPAGVSRSGVAPGVGGGWRGAPAAGAPYRAAPPAAGGWHGAPPSGSAGGWHGTPGAGAWRSNPVPNSSPLRSVPYGGAGGGWHAPSGGWHAPAPSGGGWHGSPGGSFHAPSGGGWHGSPGGGWHGGGGGFRGRH